MVDVGRLESISRAAEGAGKLPRSMVSIPNVAVRYILDQPAVAGVIVGARLGVSDTCGQREGLISAWMSRMRSGLRLYEVAGSVSANRRLRR